MTLQTKDLMTTKLVTLPVGSTLADAAKVMAENQVRHLPIVDDKDGIIGILSSRDFPVYGEYSDFNVEFFMSSPALYVDADTPMHAAIVKMLEHKVSCLLVADEKNDAAGIVTTDDLLWYLVHVLDKDSLSNKQSVWEALNAQTLGQVAHQLSLAGI